MKFHQALRLSGFLLITILMQSCVVSQYQLANDFAEKASDISVLVIPPDYLFANDIRNYQIDSLSYPDSLRKDERQFINQVVDTAYLGSFYEGFVKHLKKTGMNVYRPEESKDFFKNDSLSFTIKFSQLEIEELYDEELKKEVMDAGLVKELFYVHAVKQYTWLEVDFLQANKNRFKFYYGENKVSDIVDGYFDQNLFTGKVRYKYVRYEMQSSLLKKLPVLAAQSQAEDLYAILINNYVRRNYRLSPGMSYQWWQLDFDRMKITDAEYRKPILQEINPEKN